MLHEVIILKFFNNLLNPIKNRILICVKENRLVDAEYSRRIFYFSKFLHFYTQKNPFKLVKKSKRINITHFWVISNICSICWCELNYLYINTRMFLSIQWINNNTVILQAYGESFFRLKYCFLELINIIFVLSYK